MRSDNLVAWSQFEVMMRTGVPHAMDIASELVRHNLVIPLPSNQPRCELDLEFYCVVHRAYRAGVLSQFLSIMQQLKGTCLWDGIRPSKSKQLCIVELCERFCQATPADLARQVAAQLATSSTISKSAA